MRAFAVFALAVAASMVSAQDNANFAQPIATTVQLPTFGVSFDANGVLQATLHTDLTGQLMAHRLAAAGAVLPGNLARPSKQRKVSVVRLQRAMSDLVDDGNEPTVVMQKLAGLTRITSIF
ncbi:MAG: hypothetical protein HKN47_10620, partial [Pirellulaceae bacterium]|nr:hypothetical protein [Pirellulaceae bacterium]